MKTEGSSSRATTESQFLKSKVPVLKRPKRRRRFEKPRYSRPAAAPRHLEGGRADTPQAGGPR